MNYSHIRIKLASFAVMAFMGTTLHAQTRIIAHRGYWDCPGSAQNSLTSLRAADAIGTYGSEFDVHLTKDNKIVVNHDPTIEKYQIQTSNYKDLKKCKLRNGEKLATLEEYLDAGKSLKTRLILEIKAQYSQSHEDSLVRETVEMVKAKGLENRTDYISFSGNACLLLKKLCPKSSVSYLNGDWDPQTIKDKGLDGIDYHYRVLASHPEWIKQCHDLGLTVNVWTVNDLTDIDGFIKAGVDLITTNKPVEALKLSK